MAMAFPCPLAVDAYAAAGRDPGFPRPDIAVRRWPSFRRLMARTILQKLRRYGAWSRKATCVGFNRGAGDGNRTRTISLGIGQIMADEDAEQPTSKTRSSCDLPLVTLANCTLIARRSSADQDS